MSAESTPDLIRRGIERFVAEVPALARLKTTVRLELRARGGEQIFHIQLPGPEIAKEVTGDERIVINVPRSHFNELVRDGKVRHWKDAYLHGYVKIHGQDQILKLVATVIAKQEERARTKKRKVLP